MGRLDSWRGIESALKDLPPSVEWSRITPFVIVHLPCLAVFWVGWSWPAVAVAIALYWIRMFGITAFYHRYFSHRSFKTSRWAQFLFAVLGGSSVQRGPLWWAAHHRHHHRHSDDPEDVHSPIQDSLVWSHMGWIIARSNFYTRLDKVRDLVKYPELRFLDRFDTLVPILLALGLFGLGACLEAYRPAWGTTSWQMLIWGFFISTAVLFHGTCTINSLSHKFGNRRYSTDDHSRNNFWLALLTLGEGWHNNHHHYPGSVRQGFFWWEIDISYYLLLLLEKVGLIWDLNPVPERKKTES